MQNISELNCVKISLELLLNKNNDLRCSGLILCFLFESIFRCIASKCIASVFKIPYFLNTIAEATDNYGSRTYS